DASGDNGTARQRKIESLDRLAFEYLNRLARFKRPLLTVLQAHVAALGRVQVVAAGADLRKLVAPATVRGSKAALGELSAAVNGSGADDPDLRFPEGLPGVGGEDPATQRCSAGQNLLVIARGWLAGNRRASRVDYRLRLRDGVEERDRSDEHNDQLRHLSSPLPSSWKRTQDV